jgi:2-oxoglutarate ferredoxin oxidoreductase subunit alpha
MYSHTCEAFELADAYRVPVFVLSDAVLGSMMEPAAIPDEVPEIHPPAKPWATTGLNGRGHHNIANSLYLEPDELSEHNEKLQALYRRITEKEQRYDTRLTEDAEYLLIAYGISARVGFSAVKMAREAGIRIGLFRPITCWPYPEKGLRPLMEKAKGSLVFELSAGQMVEDARLSAPPGHPVEFFGKMGGVLPTPADVFEQIKAFVEKCNG